MQVQVGGLEGLKQEARIGVERMGGSNHCTSHLILGIGCYLRMMVGGFWTGSTSSLCVQ